MRDQKRAGDLEAGRMNYSRSTSSHLHPSNMRSMSSVSAMSGMSSTTEAVPIDNARVQYEMPDRRESTLAAPSNPIEIGFQNLHYIVPINKGKDSKTVLKNVTGTFAPGSLVGILGASGAGKTSMLNAISGELKHGQLFGEISLNGKPEECSTVRKISGFVFQDDVILPTMTVQEALEMSAKLRLPKSVSPEQVKAKLDSLVQVLGLERCRDTVIGNSMIKGVSGGERKRCAIAMELVTDPPILFLDEPTSGLDTYTAYACMALLSNLAKSGRTIIATIHQPSSEIFHLLDDLLILSDGQVMYFGPAEASVDYFASVGYKTPRFSNPADYFFMSIMNKQIRGRDEERTPEERLDMLVSHWKTSRENAAVLARHEQVAADAGVNAVGSSSHKYNAPILTQFNILMARAMKNAWRNKLIIRARFGQAIFLSVFLGLIYLQIQNRDPQSQVQDFGGASFFVAVNMLMSNSMSVLNVFAEEKAVFSREFTNGYYGLGPYYLAKIISDAPFVVFVPFVFTVIFYFMAGYQVDAGPFFIHLLAIIGTSACGQAFGIWAASLFDSIGVALALVPMILLPLMLFGGLLVNSESIPVYFNWIKWLSPVKYAFSVLLQTEFRDREICDEDEPGGQCLDGNEVLDGFNLNDEGSVWFSMAMIYVWWFVLTVIAYFGLYRIVVAAKRIEVQPEDKIPASALTDAEKRDMKHSPPKPKSKFAFWKR